jgi:ketosteroid isomerase-like protein
MAQRWPQTTSPAEGTIVETVIQFEQQWASAAKTNDPAKVAPLLSEVFVDMDADGSMHNKSESLARIKSDKWSVNEVSNIKVVVHGNMAIATGAWHGKGTLANGKMVDAHEHWLDTWLKNGKWQCIASASAPVKA